MTTTAVDPFDAATQAGNPSSVYYGRMEVSARFVKLEKGVGKTPWSEADGQDTRRTEVHLVCTPIEVSGLIFLVERRIIAESAEWGKIVWASLRDLGLKSIRDLHGKYARIEMRKTGRTYTTRRGSVAEETTMYFTALFDDLAQCEAAYRAEKGGKPAVSSKTIDMAPAAATETSGTMPAGDDERSVAKEFLVVLAKQARGDMNTLAELIAATPLVSKYFSATSPEVLEAIGAVAR